LNQYFEKVCTMSSVNQVVRACARFVLLWLVLAAPAGSLWAQQLWVRYQGTEGPGVGKHIVLVAGDDEYRSEEALPQLGKILATQHGFTCTVLFPINPETGEIQPTYQTNIPGLEALADADLVVVGLRFRDLPDEQMQHIDAYLRAGKPLVGIRTSTHAFNIRSSETYQRYHWKNAGEGYEGGFGRQVLGETWIAHHGQHGKESTRGIIAPGVEDHPIARGIEPGTIWGPTDVYTVRLPLPGDSQPIVLGAVLTGMSPDDAVLEGQKNAPMMPVAWTKTYQGDEGKTGRVFNTTMGAATDLVAEGTRRMLVNGVYWALGIEEQIPASGTAVELVGEFEPTPFGFKNFKTGTTPADYAMAE